jgi:hypothetical protein
MGQEPGNLHSWPTLDAIGSKYGTDKAAFHHGYLDFYERFLRDLRDDAVCLLEIGVAQGNSVRTWREYFPSGRIIGVDINKEAVQYAGDRITIEIADQSNVADLVRLGVQYGPFDIAIDDGSHLWNHQITTLQYIYPFVRPGGFFILEDIDTSYGLFAGTYRGNASISAAQYLQKFSDYIMGDAQLEASAEEDPFIRTFARETEFIAFHRRTAVLRRRHTPLALPIPGELFASPPPLLDVEPAGGVAPPASLTVHLPGRGDVTNDRALVGGVRGSGNVLQGFALQRKQGPADELQYRALLHDTVWTEWMPAGSYVGSRGKGLPIRGFAVRLRGDMASRFVCSYAGAFFRCDDVVRVNDGGECRAPNDAELEAIHIMLRPRA